MPITLDQQYVISVGDTDVVSINYTDYLDSGELLTGTPTVTEVTTAALTLSNKIVNTSTYTEADSGDTVAVGKAVQFAVTTNTAGLYRVRVTCTTDATLTRTKVLDVLLEFK